MAGTFASHTPWEQVPTPRRRTRRRSWLSVGAVILSVTLMSGLLTACETTDEDRSAVIEGVNAARAQAGLPALSENPTLDNKADAWASRLRDECNIRHSQLADGAPPEWRKLGENVGRGGSIDQVQVAYMNSPGHRANIMDGSYNSMGAGAVWGTCNGYRTVFTVQVFMRS